MDAVEEGRRIYDNIVKFILYLLSCNFSEVVFILACQLADLPVVRCAALRCAVVPLARRAAGGGRGTRGGGSPGRA